MTRSIWDLRRRRSSTSPTSPNRRSRPVSEASSTWSRERLWAQGIQFAASLLLARLYTPTQFGQYATILSIATVLGSLMVLSYPTAIPLAETDGESRVRRGWESPWPLFPR